MGLSKFRGHGIYEQNRSWYFSDNDELVSTTWMIRSCGHCDMENTPEGYDGCIGHLLGVMNACCGHGESAAAYIQFIDGSIIYGSLAIEKMNLMNSSIIIQ